MANESVKPVISKPSELEKQVSKSLVPQLEPYQWRPGVSGNPKGRPKSLAAKAREATNDGDSLIAFFRDAYESVSTPMRERIEAAKWLGERGFGKTPEIVLAGAMTEDMMSAAADLTRDQLLALAELPSLPSLASGLATLPAEPPDDAAVIE